MIRESSSARNYLYVLLSLLMALVLTVIPLPFGLTWMRPLWVMMVLVYWFISLPEVVGIGTAWWMGLLLDLLTGTLLGMHAFILALIAYCVLKWDISRRAPLWQQVLIMLAMIILYLALQYWIMALTGMIPGFTWQYLWPALTTLFLWPFVFLFLRRFQLRFRLLN